MKPIAILLSALLVSSCGTVIHSEPVSLKVGSIKDGDIKNGTFDEDKEINTESGNPYKEFTTNARVALDGAQPGSIIVTKITLTVGSGSDGITDGWKTVASTIEVYLTDGTSTVVAGQLDSIPDGTTIDVPITASDNDYVVLHDKMLTGSFKVGVRGNAVASPPMKFDLKTNAQITFKASE